MSFRDKLKSESVEDEGRIKNGAEEVGVAKAEDDEDGRVMVGVLDKEEDEEEKEEEKGEEEEEEETEEDEEEEARLDEEEEDEDKRMRVLAVDREELDWGNVRKGMEEEGGGGGGGPAEVSIGELEGKELFLGRLVGEVDKIRREARRGGGEEGEDSRRSCGCGGEPEEVEEDEEWALSEVIEGIEGEAEKAEPSTFCRFRARP
jgi:hypothetical protein